MKLFKLSAIIFLILSFQYLSAKRMETSLLVKQTIEKSIEALEENIKTLKNIRNFEPPEGTKLLPLSNDEITNLDNGIDKLEAAIDILRLD